MYTLVNVYRRVYGGPATSEVANQRSIPVNTTKTFQVTALFGNKFEIVGDDSYADRGAAIRIADRFRNAGREVHIHEISGSGSRLLDEPSLSEGKMGKANYTAQDPQGVIHKRSTTSRAYTHTVVGKRSYELAMRRARSTQWAKSDARDYAYEVQISEGNDPVPAINWDARYPAGKTAEQIAASQLRADAANEKRFELAKARVGNHTVQSWCEARQAERIAVVEKDAEQGYYEVFVNLGWCGRRDLADKLAAKARTDGYDIVTVLLAFEQPAKTKRVEA